MYMNHIFRYVKKIVYYILNNEWSLLRYKIRNHLFPLILYIRYFRRLVLRENLALSPLQEGSKLLTIFISNSENTENILKTIDSFIKQTLIIDKITIILDTDTGNTLKNLSKLPHVHTIYLSHAKNLCASEKLMQILSISKNRYICCLTAGDVLAPTYFEKAIFLLETYNYDLIFAARPQFSSKNLSRDYYSYESPPHLAIETFSTTKILHSTEKCAILYRRESCLHFLKTVPRVKAEGTLSPEFLLFTYGAKVFALREENLVKPYDSMQFRTIKIKDIKYLDQFSSHISSTNPNTELQYSAKNNVKMFRCLIPGGALTQAQFKGYIPKEQVQKPTILLCLGIISPGGAARLTANILSYLNNQGWHCIIISTEDYFIDNLEALLWYKTCTSELYELQKFLPDPEQRRDFILYLLQTRHVDIILQCGSDILYNFLSYIHKLKNRPIVVDLLFNTKGHTKNNQYHRKNIDHIIVENKEVMSWLINHREKTERITRISSGITIPPLTPVRLQKRKSLRESLGIPPDHMIFGYSSRLSPEKNPIAFLDLAMRCQDLPQVHFIMTGEGPLLNTIIERVTAQKLPRLYFIGYVQDPYLYISTYNMLILPSLLDGRPLVIMEAMMLGVPCLATDIGGLPELIQNGKTGFLVPPQDLDTMEQAIRQVVANPLKLYNMGIAAKTYAIKHFNIESMYQNYERTLSTVLKEHKYATKSI